MSDLKRNVTGARSSTSLALVRNQNVATAPGDNGMMNAKSSSQSNGFQRGRDEANNPYFSNYNIMPKPLNSSALLQRHQECKQQNKERLKEVRNLEDLINCKVKTVADTMEAATRKAAMN